MICLVEVIFFTASLRLLDAVHLSDRVAVLCFNVGARTVLAVN